MLSTTLISVVAIVGLLATPVHAAGPRGDDGTVVMVQLEDGTWEPRQTDTEVVPLAMLEARQEQGVVRVEPVRVYQQLGPSDPAFGDQWHLQRTGADRSWDHGDGSGVTVAVVDSGVDPVSDLACHTYVSPYDVLTGQAIVPSDSNGHGTFVTSILAECTDNGIAGAGTAPGVDIMPIRILDAWGLGTTDDLQEALVRARLSGADVVNLSLGFVCTNGYPACSDPAIDAEIAALVADGVVVVAATGNDGASIPYYPANHPSVIGVGASDYGSAVASYSNRGPGIDLVAPVGDPADFLTSSLEGVTHQGKSGFLEVGSGTSFAAPQVSGAIAILLSAGAPSGSQAMTAVKVTAKDISPSGFDVGSGFGDLRIRDALAWGGLGLTPTIKDVAYGAVGDFDGDGRDDAVTFDGAYGWWWAMESNGSGFDASKWTKFSTTSGWSEQLAGDFNGDGKDDIANFHPSNGTWWVNRSTGSAFATELWTDFSTASGWGPQLVGDFNGDGKDDIANYHSSNGTWWVSRSTGAGFTTELWADFSTAKGWKIHMVGDFNGDGKDDIANYHPSNGTWWISRSTGSGFTTSLWADFSTASGWQTHIVGDFNGDGKDDIANFHPSNGTWWITVSNGSTFATSLWSDFTTASGWGPQLVGDFNGDGKDDIANYHSSNGTWWISRSTGSGFSISLWADYAASKGWIVQAVGDFDNDGKDDIANLHSDGTWRVSKSQGTSFTSAIWFE